MKINIKNIKSKIIFYFREHLDQTVVIIILFITITNAISISIVFYLAVLSPGNFDIGSRDYKYIRIKVNQEVLEKLDKRGKVDQKIISEIDSAKDPFK